MGDAYINYGLLVFCVLLLLSVQFPLLKTFFDFNIDIHENRIEINLDTDTYFRILNNLIQNVNSHSQAAHIEMRIYLLDKYVRITVVDGIYK